MISAYIYISILAALLIIFFILSAVLIILIRRRPGKNIEASIKTIIPIVSPLLDNAFFWVNLDGFISFANDHALKILKIDSKEIEKTNLASIFASNEDVNKILLMESDRPLKLQTNLISRDKEIIPTQLNAVLIKALNNPIGYILIADDIHLREIMNARLEMEKCKKSADDHSRIHHEYSEKINKLNTIIQKIFSAPQNDLINIIKEFSGELHNLFESYMTTCWILEDGNEKLKLIAQYGLSEKGIEKFEKDFPTSNKIIQSLDRKEVTLNDISLMQNSLRVLLTQEGVSNIAEVPFFRKDAPCGVLEFYLKNKSDSEVTKQLLNHISVLLTTICSIFYIKISNDNEVKRLHEEKTATEKRLMEKVESCSLELEELRQLQKLTIGRELKILELKKKISELEDAMPDGRQATQE
ncbi:MAG: hypothetical protein US71_C0001G0132 [Parcubacteria group bacterium GW2011_GWD2_38_12]|nr:MAG: hypothetical protein US06_C0002G0044 [Parcubacteria group bacterium GW2011_GWC2_36_17]KKQ38731.1 MAG: hypothetical protein US56_C0037G0001 [Candidatus Moranbacteria bacterium GW2011_GWF2_37_7]KKQ42747.1 MAG: hypothetical protein US61_C0021G0007 [Parcubacteria group bacterium GW2011_GWE2_37_8]KKQ52928.1 MAG: hypothetical protein US71_C0001G0132 [Parcubacteria group bacterium GW2011_GWD2_38_12]KKQ59133.1 MAG: hypothetical protein US79_C0001G0133 [Parcubacteria group bacterium GW2011_GWC1_